MLPSLTDYLRGMRRLWWLPVLTILVGVGIGLVAVSGARSTSEASAKLLFALRADEAGSGSADSSVASAESVARARLPLYVEAAIASPEVQEILEENGIEGTESPSGSLADSDTQVSMDVLPDESGLVEVRLTSQALSPAAAAQLVSALSEEVTRQVLEADGRQASPSLLPEPVIAQGQAVSVSPPRTMTLALPILLLGMVGFGLVYLIVWRQDRIYSQRDIEDRVGARVLGDIAGRTIDTHAIVLALTKGRDMGTRALLVPIGGRPGAAVGLGETLAAAGREMGLDVSLNSTDAGLPDQVYGAAEGNAIEGPSGVHLTVVESPNGLDTKALMASGAAHIVALVVSYGETSYGDLNAAGKTLSEVTTAELAVVGIDL